MNDSKIQWTDHTANLWWGCVEVGPGCDHCYAKTLASRYGRNVWGAKEPRWFTKNWRSTLKNAQRVGEQTGVRQRVFIQSMSDICEVLHGQHPDRAQMDAVRQELWDMWPSLTMVDGQFLTKRVGNVYKVVPNSWMNGKWPSNAWMGISVVNQEEADRDICKLAELPAPIKFLSVEPMIDRLQVSDDYLADIGWVICGGESGKDARSMNIVWAQLLADQCRKWQVPFFMKQLGKIPTYEGEAWNRGPDAHGGDIKFFPIDLRIREFPLPVAEGDVQ